MAILERFNRAVGRTMHQPARQPGTSAPFGVQPTLGKDFEAGNPIALCMKGDGVAGFVQGRQPHVVVVQHSG